MGWTLKDVEFEHDGTPATVHADGNNVAWICPSCRSPVLLVYLRGRIGSHPDRPSPCPGCDAAYSLEPPFGFQPEPPKGKSVAPVSRMTIKRSGPAPPPVPVLALSGSVGVGKSTVLEEMHDVLAARAVPHACIELDALACSWPARGYFNEDAALENLAAVWANYAAAGAGRLVVGSVIERAADLEGVRRAVPGARITVCRLVASEATRLARLRERERGAGLDWHLHRTVELDGILDTNGLEDFTVVNEDQPLRRVAEEVLVRAGWIEPGAVRLPGDE